MFSNIRLVEKLDPEPTAPSLYGTVGELEDDIEELESLLASHDSVLDQVVAYKNRLLPARLVTMFRLIELYDRAGYKKAARELLKQTEGGFLECLGQSRLLAEELYDLLVVKYLDLGDFASARRVAKPCSKAAVMSIDEENHQRKRAEEFLLHQFKGLIDERERRANKRAERVRFFKTENESEDRHRNPFAFFGCPEMIPQGA